jgi:hypothetical protein
MTFQKPFRYFLIFVFLGFVSCNEGTYLDQEQIQHFEKQSNNIIDFSFLSRNTSKKVQLEEREKKVIRNFLIAKEKVLLKKPLSDFYSSSLFDENFNINTELNVEDRKILMNIGTSNLINSDRKLLAAFKELEANKISFAKIATFISDSNFKNAKLCISNPKACGVSAAICSQCAWNPGSCLGCIGVEVHCC